LNSLRKILFFIKPRLVKEVKVMESTSNISNLTLDSEWEKQSIIWSAFGVDYKRELQQLEEAKNAFLTQLNNSIVDDKLKDFIEQVIRDEVRRILKGCLNVHRKQP